MYSCMVLALHMLATFCPEVGLQEAQAGLGLGWPHTATLCSLQKQCHALSHCQLPLSSRGKALARNLKGCLLLTTHLPNQMHVPLSERQAKDVTSSGHKLQMFLSKS